MDAHHPDATKKEIKLSLVLTYSSLPKRKDIFAELDSCKFMCCRCHQNTHHDPRLTHEETYQRKDKGRKIDERKQKIRQLFGEHCFSCNDWLYPKEMEFHHRIGQKKAAEVSTLIRFGSWESVVDEIKKCQIFCRNCHRLELNVA